MQDISASRTHAIITYKGDRFFIEDSNSKFGTLVKSSAPIPMSDVKQTLQVRNLIVSFTMRPKSKTPMSNLNMIYDETGDSSVDMNDSDIEDLFDEIS